MATTRQLVRTVAGPREQLLVRPAKAARARSVLLRQLLFRATHFGVCLANCRSELLAEHLPDR